ncbi:hypothetical protein C8R43DRAFT_1122792 [Mycena crocata]|nr:hypothetical protein C8R43DRAFT_1122792 [Mycena crocata]
MMLKEIAMTFEAGRIPTISELEKLEDSKEKKKFYQWYAKEGAGGEEVLKALVRGAKDEWEDEFEDTHCDSEEWDALPTCKKHDFDWLDLISLLVTVAVFGGIIYAVLSVVRSVSQGVESAKEGLKTKGLHITDQGVSVKTSKRFDREDYVDATQRGFVKAVNASSFRKGGAAADDSDGHLSPPPLNSASSSSSINSNGDKKKGFFKRSTSSTSKDH